MELKDIRKLDKQFQMQHLSEEQMENMSLDELQEVIKSMNKGKKIENDQFEAFQVLLLKDINITTDEV